MPLALLYALFAALSTAVNIGTQHLSVLVYTGMGQVPLSMVAGTGTGLVVKYVLDKRYIFRFQTEGVKHEGSTFALYTIMGLFTTVIFWGMELGFEAWFHTDAMRYAGGVLGLAVGYWVKYRLDKRFVFRG